MQQEFCIKSLLFILAEHLAVSGSLIHSKSKYRDERVGENLRSQSWPVNGS